MLTTNQSRELATYNRKDSAMRKENHKICDCSKFLNLKVQVRWSVVKKINAYFCCLNIGDSTH